MAISPLLSMDLLPVIAIVSEAIGRRRARHGLRSNSRHSASSLFRPTPHLGVTPSMLHHRVSGVRHVISQHRLAVFGRWWSRMSVG